MFYMQDEEPEFRFNSAQVENWIARDACQRQRALEAVISRLQSLTIVATQGGPTAIGRRRLVLDRDDALLCDAWIFKRAADGLRCGGTGEDAWRLLRRPAMRDRRNHPTNGFAVLGVAKRGRQKGFRIYASAATGRSGGPGPEAASFFWNEGNLPRVDGL